ncbi:MAG: DUF1232 domain-containing protein [bacterium]
MEEKTNQLQTMFAATASHIMILPRLVKLLLGLFRDARVPRWLKFLTAGAILYVALPIDLLPDFVPTAGWVDDMVVIFLILIQYMKYCPPAVFKENWDNTMGDAFSLETDLLKTVERLEPLVGDRYASIRNTVAGLTSKITEYNAQKTEKVVE